MFGYLFTSSLREFLAPRKLLLWVLGLFIMALLIGLVVWQGASSTPQARFDQLSGMMGFRVVAIVTAIYSVWVIAGEVEQRTIVYLLTRPIPRPTLLFGRALGAFTAAAILNVLVILTIWFVTGRPGRVPLQEMGTVVLGTFAYGAIFLFISLILNKAMIYCLLYAFGFELLAPNLPGELYVTSVQSHLANLAAAGKTATTTGKTILEVGASTPLPVQASIAFLIGFFVVGMAASAFWFKTFEFVPREDAE